MPIMDVRYAAGSLEKEAKAVLAQKLTDVLIRMEGGANTPGGRGFAWVFFTAFAEDDWWIGGRAGDEYVSPPGKFLVHIAIPEGYMNIAHKNEVHAWVAAAIAEVAGSGAGGSILTVIDEVTEGNWGNAGHPISLESIAEMSASRNRANGCAGRAPISRPRLAPWPPLAFRRTRGACFRR